MSKSDKIYPSIHYNEDKTAVTLVIVSGMPIREKEFIASLYDFLQEYGKGFRYEEIGELVEFEMTIDDEYDGSPKH